MAFMQHFISQYSKTYTKSIDLSERYGGVKRIAVMVRPVFILMSRGLGL